MKKQIIALARELVAASPKNPGCWFTLADTLRRSGALDQAIDCLDTAVTSCGDDLRLVLCRARSLYALNDFSRAREAVEQAMQISPSLAEARSLHCEILLRMGDHDAAGQAIAALGANVPELFDLRVRALLAQSRFDDVIGLCDARLRGRPSDTNAIFAKAKALSKLERYVEACQTLTLDRFIEIAALEPQMSDAPDFRADVVEEILRNRTLVPNPTAKATRDGLHTLQLRQPDAPAIETLIRLIKAKIETYIDRLGEADHPFILARPAKARLSVWAIVYGAAGRQAPHHHADGWLSGVYFVRAARRGADDAFSGDLLLGPLMARGGIDADYPRTRRIEPIPGRIVLFPSYVPHATIAPEVENERIVVSFDVVPEATDLPTAGHN